MENVHFIFLMAHGSEDNKICSLITEKLLSNPLQLINERLSYSYVS